MFWNLTNLWQNTFPHNLSNIYKTQDKKNSCWRLWFLNLNIIKHLLKRLLLMNNPVWKVVSNCFSAKDRYLHRKHANPSWVFLVLITSGYLRNLLKIMKEECFFEAQANQYFVALGVACAGRRRIKKKKKLNDGEHEATQSRLKISLPTFSDTSFNLYI